MKCGSLEAKIAALEDAVGILKGDLEARDNRIKILDEVAQVQKQELEASHQLLCAARALHGHRAVAIAAVEDTTREQKREVELARTRASFAQERATFTAGQTKLSTDQAELTAGQVKLLSDKRETLASLQRSVSLMQADVARETLRESGAGSSNAIRPTPLRTSSVSVKSRRTNPYSTATRTARTRRYSEGSAIRRARVPFSYSHAYAPPPYSGLD
ncbi:hypothetical protein C8R43DRAFT_994423 [Mycena crocata]|nr:hypothetical protein C8R43DRAFT_994423 [Mycena crocata]